MNAIPTERQSPAGGLIFRHTNRRKGRHAAVTTENSSMEHLCYGRIILDSETPRVAFEAGASEIGLICLSGEGVVRVGDEAHTLGRYDAIYIPRDSSVEVTTESGVDFVECSARVESRFPLQIVRYADVERDASLKFKTGGPASTRTINILIGKNVEAGRILAGVTTSEPGHWTSWPPHEHAAMLEEIYVYYDMPPPAFGAQFVYDDAEQPEFVGIVRDGDAALMPRGFHPNVSIPGHTISFVWMMAARREVVDREFGVVRVQPGFDNGGSGLEASRK
ncbi:MAG TPA: 5-deoxy-glucuronate isomerase [Blastocatellia bacterium]